jgi:GT2 family glycosyltransferase/nucleoside-diphosphate-sugar epimerase
MTTSIVIVTFQTGPALWLAVDSALAQKECRELIVVDNGNPKDVYIRLQAIAKTDPRLKLITGQGNVGFAKGCNIGANVAEGEYLLLLNPDSVLPENALMRCEQELSVRPDVMVAGCYLANPDGSEQRGGRRQLLNPINGVLDSLNLYRFFKSAKAFNLYKQAMPNEVHEIPTISGSFMFMRLRDYRALKGMDERYFLHMEDMDFCYRVHEAGKKIICIPDIKVLHFRSTSEVSSNFIEWHKTRGLIMYFYTHFRHKYFPGVLALLSVGIILRFVVKVIMNFLTPIISPESLRDVGLRQELMLRTYARNHSLGDRFKGESYMITGATSQVGFCMIGRLLASGANVQAFSHTSEVDFSHPNLSWQKIDLTNQILAPEQIRSKILVHIASIWYLPAQIPALAAGGVKRIIAFSSTSIEGKASAKNEYEIDLVDKLKKSEADIARLCNEHDIKYTIIRPTMIYGLGLDNNIARIARTLRKYNVFPLYGAAKGKRMPVHADDLATAVLQSSVHPYAEGKTYNLSGASEISYIDMVNHIAMVLGIDPRIIRPPLLPTMLDWLGKLYGARNLTGDMAVRMNQDLVFDHSPATQDFGYSPRPFVFTSDMI